LPPPAIGFSDVVSPAPRIGMRLARALGSSGVASRSSSTPFSYFASHVSGSVPSGSRIARSKRP
jgi:hypothetical protein